MAAIRITNFKGIAPRVSPRLLAENNAQIASNCVLTSGELRPLAMPSVVFEPNRGVRLETIYLADTIWLTWPFDVDVARSPLPGEQRFIYTGDGEPRITTVTLAASGLTGKYPEDARPLGLPAPQTAVSVSASGGSAGATVSRIYTYTFFDDWGQESAAAPVSTLVTGRTDDTWALTGMDTAPANSGTGTVTVTGSPGAEITTFTNGSSALHWLRPGDMVVIDGTDVIVETTPTTSSFTVKGDFTGETTWARKMSWGTVTKRIYRTAGTLAQFQLVVDNIAAATTSYNDTILDINILGDELVSADWVLPPTNLRGIVTLPSGALAGFSGNEICFSEPFQPHAWPVAYRLRSDFPIVSLQYYSSGLVAGTTGKPVQIIGLEPGQQIAQPVNGAYPCLSKRSTVSLVDSVGFATEMGFVTIGDAGINTITKDWFTRDEWFENDPYGMIAQAVRGRLYIHIDTDLEKTLIFDFLDGTGLTEAFVLSSAMYADPISGKLYVSCSCNFDIREFDPADGTYLSQDWKSKEFVVPDPINFGAAKVNFTARFTQAQIDALQQEYEDAIQGNDAILATGKVNGEMNAYVLNGGYLGSSDLARARRPDLELPEVDFTLYAKNDEVVFSKTIKNGQPFRLPSGYKSDTFAISLRGQVLVKSVEMAETVIGLKQA
jgi:hypothetical protein